MYIRRNLRINEQTYIYIYIIYTHMCAYIHVIHRYVCTYAIYKHMYLITCVLSGTWYGYLNYTVVANVNSPYAFS